MFFGWQPPNEWRYNPAFSHYSQGPDSTTTEPIEHLKPLICVFFVCRARSSKTDRLSYITEWRGTERMALLSWNVYLHKTNVWWNLYTLQQRQRRRTGEGEKKNTHPGQSWWLWSKACTGGSNMHVSNDGWNKSLVWTLLTWKQEMQVHSCVNEYK